MIFMFRDNVAHFTWRRRGKSEWLELRTAVARVTSATYNFESFQYPDNRLQDNKNTSYHRTMTSQ
jgi:hypothetical protein